MFPVEAKAITEYVKQALRNKTPEIEESSMNSPVQSFTKSLSRVSIVIQSVKKENEKIIEESKEINENISELHDLIQSFDNLDFSTNTSTSFQKIDHKRIEAAGESILSMEKRFNRLPIVAPPNSPQQSKKPLKKSLYTLSSAHQKKINVPTIPKQKSSTSASNPKPTAKVSSFLKIKRETNSSLSSSVQRMLLEAKDKRKKPQVEICIPVVNLKFV